MLCIFCLKERPSTEEHIFPLAIGGTVTTDRVCESCNSGLGSRVDAALSDFFPIRARRAKLGLAGNGGEVPGLHEFFLGMANLVGVEANQVHTAFNKSTGKLDLKQIPHKSETTLTSGETSVQITVDARDRGKLPKMIQRERTLRNLPPLPEEELANAVNNFAVNSVENPVVHITRAIDFKYLRHAMMKIAYELAFLWLGEAYLDDPKAALLREAICSADPSSTDHIDGYVGFATEDQFKIFQAWIPHEAHHLAYSWVLHQLDRVVIAIRVFDIYGAMITVSDEAGRYFQNAVDYSAKQRLLAIDTVTKKTIDVSFGVEQRRIAEAMDKYKRYPPFHDPLSEIVE